VTDHGILFQLSDGKEIRVTAVSLLELVRYLTDAPGGAEGSPSASSAAATIQQAFHRRDEVRSFQLSEAEEAEIIWALERNMYEGFPYDLMDLRHSLTAVASEA